MMAVQKVRSGSAMVEDMAMHMALPMGTLMLVTVTQTVAKTQMRPGLGLLLGLLETDLMAVPQVLTGVVQDLQTVAALVVAQMRPTPGRYCSRC